MSDKDPDAQDTQNGVGYFEHDVETLKVPNPAMPIQAARSHSQSQSRLMDNFTTT